MAVAGVNFDPLREQSGTIENKAAKGSGSALWLGARTRNQRELAPGVDARHAGDF